MSNNLNDPGAPLSPITSITSEYERLQKLVKQDEYCENCDHSKEQFSVVGTSMKLVEKESDSGANQRKIHQSKTIRYQKNCYRLEDTNAECAPIHLQQIFQRFDLKKLNSSEILLLLIYIVALESGYCTQRQCATCFNYIVKLSSTSSFDCNNLQRLTRSSLIYDNDSKKSKFTIDLQTILDLRTEEPYKLQSKLIAITSGDYLIVTLTPDCRTNEAGGSVCLSVGRYILETAGKNKPYYNRFQKLNELSFQLREKLFVPIRNRQLALLNMQIYPSLVGLPPELYENIFKYLSKNQLNILANVNRLFNRYVNGSRYYRKRKIEIPQHVPSASSLGGYMSFLF